MNDIQLVPSEVPSKANPLWGGRFNEGASELLKEINSSVHFDKRLALQDIAGSIAHAEMLAFCGVLGVHEVKIIISGLHKIKLEIETGIFVFDSALEDVHMNVESRLHVIVGPVAGRLHTGRSRNDQVAVDTKMWVRDATDRLDALLYQLIEIIVEQANNHYAHAMPGFTHMQCAQPVTLGHHLLAYGEMFFRDRDRLLDARRRLNESPLGAAALAGTSYPINPVQTAHTLGFDRPTRNSLDAVSDRDFVLDYMMTAATMAMHMSRLAEELVIWSSPQFDFAHLPENLTAGSSIMPQKRNPDTAELVRAKSGRVFGNLMALLAVLKGLPLAYSRDMQEDKEALFDSADTVELCVRATTAMLAGITINLPKMKNDATLGNSSATDLADWLVREQKISFRESHGIVGNLVKWLEERGKELQGVTQIELASFDPRFDQRAADVLNVNHAIASRNSFGGTAPERVKTAAATLHQLNASLATNKLKSAC
ncbi:Argininosuccinate lyase [Collimonas arenae]|uniref:Argininosuccinate lyase n=1 Tax=Collimonas arenae TaxID=279058 RepID=A0A0A1FM87_9BURK|nr:argininosuccinate lyase [Collimonas arenae]AIY44082.1 Argininosuccinate lyase [Collimonas arenae]